MTSSPARKRMPLRSAFAWLFWKLGPYTLERESPAHEGPRILLGAPHTANFDFLLMLAIAWDARLPIRWLGKQELFVTWRGPLMRALGGIPVNRKNPAGLVDAVVAQAKSTPDFALVITPEGTRSGNGWKSGFVRIAHAANLPVTLGWVDGPSKRAGLGPTITLTDDLAADMDRIRAFYADKRGVHPDKRTEPRLARESRQAVMGEADAQDAPGNAS